MTGSLRDQIERACVRWHRAGTDLGRPCPRLLDDLEAIARRYAAGTAAATAGTLIRDAAAAAAAATGDARAAAPARRKTPRVPAGGKPRVP